MATLTHYDDGNILEEVFKTVTNIKPYETVFFSGMGKRKIISTIDQWPEDTLSTAGDNAAVEGGSITYGTVTAPTRSKNLTQIFKKTFSVSGTEIAVKGAGVEDQYLYQKLKAMQEIGTDIELALLHGSIASGTGSLARRMAGAVKYITTLATAVVSGTKLTESFFNGQIQGAWTNGGMINEVMVGGQLQRVISSYNASSTRFASVEDKRLVNSVKVYENDFAITRIIPHRFINSTTNSNATALFLTSRLWKVGVLRPIAEIVTAQTVDGKQGVLIGELTLEALAQRGNAVVTGLDTSFVV